MQAAVMDTWCVMMFRREKIELNFIYKAPNHSRVQISFQADSVCKCIVSTCWLLSLCRQQVESHQKTPLLHQRCL